MNNDMIWDGHLIDGDLYARLMRAETIDELGAVMRPTLPRRLSAWFRPGSSSEV